jgi:molybdenum cofactor biosynthesis enzyme MoaA
MLKQLTFSDIASIAETWLLIGGNKKIEIGALEPLLWKDRGYFIHDVVSLLHGYGFKVSMTTNGQLLSKFSDRLATAGLSLIRTSWHTTNPILFKEISGGYGDYNKFIEGINSAVNLGIKVDFNKVLMKGYTDDISEQLKFIEKHRSRIKLYTLLWTPDNASSYLDTYVDWRDVVRKHVLKNTCKIKRVTKEIGREKIQFYTNGGGLVEIKLGDMLNRTNSPCSSCLMKEKCEEGFGDYVRIDPRLHLYFCYLRHDIGFSLREYFQKPYLLKQRMQDSIGSLDIESLLSKTSLRLTITPFCNFNCRSPGSTQGWCMEAPGDYSYPKIKPSLLK